MFTQLVFLAEGFTCSNNTMALIFSKQKIISKLVPNRILTACYRPMVGVCLAKEETDSNPVPLKDSPTSKLMGLQGPLENSPEAKQLAIDNSFSYRKLLGKLIFAYMICRFDIGYTVCFLAWFSKATRLWNRYAIIYVPPSHGAYCINGHDCQKECVCITNVKSGVLKWQKSKICTIPGRN